jgi:hypothetical protein
MEAVVAVLLLGVMTDNPGIQPEQDLPVVLVIRCATEASGRRRERTYLGKLGLALDDFFLMGIQTPDPDFSKKQLAEQMALSRPVAEEHGATAVVWLGVRGDVVIVNLAAHDIDEVRVQVLDSSKSNADLALATRELLGKAYLEHRDRIRHEAIHQIVDEVAPSPAVGAEATQPAWFLRLSAVTEVGLEARGATWYPGLGGGGTLAVGPIALNLGVAGTMAINPNLRTGDLSINRLRATFAVSYPMELFSRVVSPDVGIGYAWTHYSIRLDPVSGEILIGTEGEQRLEFERDSHRLAVSAGVTVAGSHVGPTWNAGLHILALPVRDEFRRQSSGRRVFLSESYALSLAVGVLL